jgi:hypothetical protein
MTPTPDPIIPPGYGAVLEYRHIHISENPDSLEIGTPGKGGAVKIYGNFLDPEGFRAKIKAAYELRQYAAELLTGGER